MSKKALSIVVVFIVIVAFIFFPKGIFPVATNIFLHRNSSVEETSGRTNILLLGTGGVSHDGPNLTDTIMIASINVQKNSITLISLPRDLWVPSLGTEGEKINEAYADGQSKGNKGLVLAKAIVNSVTNQPIHYGLRIDFAGFVKAIELIGGIDVNVAQTLDDYHYPIDGQEEATCNHAQTEIQNFTATVSADQQLWDFFPCRYKHLHVDLGLQHMDGITALEFVRSRHGVGQEGSDFARSRRQQLVLEALRSKVLSLGIVLNPPKLIGLYNIVKDSVDTDIPQEDFLPFLSLFQKIKSAKIQTAVIDDGNSTPGKPGLLIDSTQETSYGSVFALHPRLGTDNFSEVKSFIDCELQLGNCTIAQTPGISPKAIKKAK